MTVYNTYVKFKDNISNEIVTVSIAFLIESGIPIDEEGDDMELYDEKLTQNDGTEAPDDIKVFDINDMVDVKQGDSHYAFTGKVIKVNHNSVDGVFYTVEDQDSDFWDCDGKDMTLNDDE